MQLVQPSKFFSVTIFRTRFHVLAEHVYTASSGDEVVEQLKDLNFQPIADFSLSSCLFISFLCIMLHVGFAI